MELPKQINNINERIYSHQLRTDIQDILTQHGDKDIIQHGR